jgi:phospholipid/cholesterol/gamma-HCH transport system ATP-binding protein
VSEPDRAPPARGDAPAIRIVDVHKRFGQRRVLAGASLEVARGARLGLIGPAASGKTVLCKLVCGLEQPDRGTVEVLGETIAGRAADGTSVIRREASLGPLRRRIGMLFQSYALFDFLSVEENVAFPLEQRGGHAPDAIAAKVAERLRAVGLAGSEQKRVGELSGGMKKRVGIARATVADPELVIYDEPSAGLDPVTTQKIYDLLAADHARTGATVLAVSSDVVALAQFVDEIAFVHRGRIAYRGPAAAIADAPDPLVRQFVRGELEGPLEREEAAAAAEPAAPEEPA